MTTRTQKEGPARGANGADEGRGLRGLTGVLLILTPIAFNVFFTFLSVTFEYPDILREPTGYILRHFDAGGSSLVAMWYGFMLTAVLFVPLSILVHKVLAVRAHLTAVATALCSRWLWCSSRPIAGRSGSHTWETTPIRTRRCPASRSRSFPGLQPVRGVGWERTSATLTALWTMLVDLAMFGSPPPFRGGALLEWCQRGILVGMLKRPGSNRRKHSWLSGT